MHSQGTSEPASHRPSGSKSQSDENITERLKRPAPVSKNPTTSRKSSFGVRILLGFAVLAGIAGILWGFGGRGLIEEQVKKLVAYFAPLQNLAVEKKSEESSGVEHAHSSAGTESHTGEEASHDSTSQHPEKSESHGGGEHAMHKVLVTNPIIRDVPITERYVCQIHSRKHIEIRALNEGYLQEVLVKEGQAVTEGSQLFTVIPVLYQARLDSEVAEFQVAQVEYDNTKRLLDEKVITLPQLKLAEAKLAKAKANVDLARAELEFSRIKAPFDGIIDRLREQKGSLLEEGAVLTTLSDNSVMWAYFNVTEARYLRYQEEIRNAETAGGFKVQLELANHKLFPNPGSIGAIEADFNNETGNIAFRADIPNPDGVLRHGQTGTILVEHIEKDAIVIPQRAVYEILAKTYVYVVDEKNTVRQREIEIAHEKDDIFLVGSGLAATDKIIYEGQRQVRDGDVIESEFRAPDQVLSNLKYHAE